MITTDLDQPAPDLAALVAEVQERREPAQLTREGLPAAELWPGPERQRQIVQNPRLARVVLLEDPMAPLDEKDWEFDDP
jgi:hypothetical protein